MKISKKIIGFTLLLLVAMVVGALLPVNVSEVLAQSSNLSSGGGGLTIPQGNVQISSSISNKPLADSVLLMVNYFIGFLGFLATLAFIYAGALWILNGGNDDLISKSKKIMTYAVLGILVIILSYSIVGFVANSLQGGASNKSGSGLQCGQVTCSVGQTCAFDQNNNPVCRNVPSNNKSGSTNKALSGSVKSGPSKPVVNKNIDQIDQLKKGVEKSLNLSGLSKKAKAESDKALVTGDIDQKIKKIKDLIKNPSQFGLLQSDVDLLNTFLNGLEQLKLIRSELDELRKVMPESKIIIQAYDETSDALDLVLDDPSNTVKYRRFEAKYDKLKDLIRQFPVMEANIVAFPGEGNVPFTVQFDGLNSVDPTGGTVASYKWTYIDKTGSEVVIGTDPVITYEFKEANTYVVRLQISTAQKDSQGYKTAADGISTVRIKANPPTSKVSFRINGVAAQEIMTYTLKEARAGLSFDPSVSTAALGRKLVKYEWFYGDNKSEVRQVPATVVHTYNDAGEYFVKLEVTDNLGIKDKRVVKLFVKSLAAQISSSPSKGNVNTQFRFEGGGSRSDDGVITKFEWVIRDSNGQVVADGEEASIAHRFKKPGDYKVSLTVTDITGAKDQSIKTVEVESRDPIAQFNHSIPRKNQPNKVAFTAINSYDPDEGDKINYSWDFDGDGNFEVTKSDRPTAEYEYKRKGDYRVKLQVQDQFGGISTAEKNISINSVLSADIELPLKAVRVGDTVKFKVKSSNAVSYLWEFGDGQVKSTDKNEVEHTYSKTGKYTVKLNFFDKDDNDNSVSQRILVGASDEPMAFIDYTVNSTDKLLVEDLCGTAKDGMVISRQDRLRFDGRSSINTDGSSRLLSYNWTFPSGEKSTEKDPIYKFDEMNKEGGCFKVNLVVRDEISGKVSKEDVTYFKVINRLPTITDFILETNRIESVVTPLKVKARVIAPQDKDGSIKKYRWWYYREGAESKRLGLHSTSDSETTLTITSIGQPEVTNRYYFVVEVLDNDGGVYLSEEQFKDSVYLEVKNGPNLSPVADFTVDKSTISAGDSVTFFSRSYDPQGEVLPNDAFRWDFDGDGAFDDVSSGPQVNRQFNTPGEYKARLKVVHRGLSSSATQTIVVEPTESLPQPAFTYKIKGNEVEFDASFTRYDPTLSDTNLRFEWDFDVDTDENGNGIKDDDNQSDKIKTGHTYDQKKKYKVRLKVTDSLGVEGVVVRVVDLNLSEQERQRSAVRTLEVTAPRHPLTSLVLEVVPATLEKGESADIQARVLNADNSVYEGKVYFEVIEGTGQFTPNPSEANQSIASTVFTAVDSGLIKIKVTATETLYGELTEEVVIQVK